MLRKTASIIRVISVYMPVVHLCALFRNMIKCSSVPDNFGSGLIIPLLKDKVDDVISLDYCRGITLIPTHF